MLPEKNDIIECPNCHAQYLPVEIFIPDEYFGRPKHIERNKSNKIIDVIGQQGNQTEHFVCEFCNRPFRISAKMLFSTKIESKFNFDDEYATKLKKETLFLKEE